ncbi:MAG: glycoside-pentoside-hexuronide (GPH):cation symporter [Oscillospiraceae bacterium]
MAKKEPKLDANGFRKFGLLDKVAYGAGDFGCNMSFALKGTLTIFWTQFMGIDSILMASLLLLVQIWDAINDPVIGAMVDADRHHYKRGKFLAYIWAGSVGLLVAGALCFVPWAGAPAMVKNILFVAGYIIWDAFYTVANVPYGSVLSLITADPVERVGLSTWRSVGGMGGGMLAMALLPALIYDKDNNLMGERVFIIALVMGVVGFIAFQFMIRNTVIRVKTDVKVNENAPKFNIITAFTNFMRNRAAVGATLAPVGTFIGMYGAQVAMQIMFQSYFKNARIAGVVSMFGMLGMLAFMPFIGKIVKRFGKKEAITFGASVSVLAYILMLILPITPDGKGLVLFVMCQILNALGAGIGTCVSWSLMADAMDYGEWKFGVREEGTTYALHSFFRKLAQGVGPSLGLMACAALGYEGTLGAAQTAATALNMRYLTAGAYLFSAVVTLVAYGLVYNLDKKTLAKMEQDLGRATAEVDAASALNANSKED